MFDLEIKTANPTVQDIEKVLYPLGFFVLYEHPEFRCLHGYNVLSALTSEPYKDFILENFECFEYEVYINLETRKISYKKNSKNELLGWILVSREHLEKYLGSVCDESAVKALAKTWKRQAQQILEQLANFDVVEYNNKTFIGLENVFKDAEGLRTSI